MSRRAAKVDLADHGQLTRADGRAAQNGYFWAQEAEDHFQLHGRHADGDWLLWVVPLSDGRWLATPPGAWLRGPYFKSRSDALRTAVAHVLRKVRRRQRPLKYEPLFWRIREGTVGHVTAWLFDILIRELGPCRRWRWRRARGRALALAAGARWDLESAELNVEAWARRQVGEPPWRPTKRQWAKYDAEVQAHMPAAMDALASEIQAAIMRASSAQLRCEQLAAARPWA